MERLGRVDTRVSLLLLLLRLTATVLTAQDCCVHVPDPNITSLFFEGFKGDMGEAGPIGASGDPGKLLIQKQLSLKVTYYTTRCECDSHYKSASSDITSGCVPLDVSWVDQSISVPSGL